MLIGALTKEKAILDTFYEYQMLQSSENLREISLTVLAATGQRREEGWRDSETQDGERRGDWSGASTSTTSTSAPAIRHCDTTHSNFSSKSICRLPLLLQGAANILHRGAKFPGKI